MPLALAVSIHALALYDHLCRRDVEGKPAFGISQVQAHRLDVNDLDNQRAWRELVDAGLAVEAPDYGRYSKYDLKG